MKYIILANILPKIVGYEWINCDGVKYSFKEEGLVEAKVSDWENAYKSEISGRKIVHIYWIQDTDGSVKPYGKFSALKKLGVPEVLFKKYVKPFEKKIQIKAQNFRDEIIELKSWIYKYTVYKKTGRVSNLLDDVIIYANIHTPSRHKDNLVFIYFDLKESKERIYTYFCYSNDDEEDGYGKGNVQSYLLKHKEIHKIKDVLKTSKEQLDHWKKCIRSKYCFTDKDPKVVYEKTRLTMADKNENSQLSLVQSENTVYAKIGSYYTSFIVNCRDCPDKDKLIKSLKGYEIINWKEMRNLGR